MGGVVAASMVTGSIARTRERRQRQLAFPNLPCRCYGAAMPINETIAIAVFAAAVMIGIAAVQPGGPEPLPPLPVAVSSTALPLDRDDPAASRLGALTFMGAVQLRSTNEVFGGISSLRIGNAVAAAPESVPMLAVTDAGQWLAFTAIESGGRLVDVRDAMMAPILEPDGRPARSKTEGDAEALEWQAATGAASVVYEQNHRIAHFAGIDPARPASLATVPRRIEGLTAMTGWPANGGGEAMALLPDGTRIIIGERATRPDGSHVALLTQGGTTREIGIAPVADHAPTDAVAIDATRILVLHRRFNLAGQGAAISLVDLGPALGDVAATAPLPTRVLARWQPPATVDNMEGIAIRRDGERWFVYVVSDDNFNSMQRTILMKFEIDPAALAPATAAPATSSRTSGRP